MKKENKIITFITCYDYSFATSLNSTSIDLVLVGDSGGMVALGYENTNPVTMDEMILMSKAVRRGAPNKFIVGDMPKGSYEISNQLAVENAMRFAKESNCDAVKLEGGENIVERTKAIAQSGIGVMGHIGLTPQSSGLIGGYKVVGRSVSEKDKIFKDAESLVNAGVFSILVEATPNGLAQELSNYFSIPVLGIGAGSGIDGQLLILHDLLGLYPNFRPKFSTCYVPDVIKEFGENLNSKNNLTEFGSQTRRDGLWEITRLTVETYCENVRTGKFPAKENIYLS